MLLHDYSSYILQIVQLAILSFAGIVSVVLLLVSIVIFFKYRPGQGLIRYAPSLAILSCAAIVFTYAFYNTIYEYDQSLDRLLQMRENPDDEDCGTAWTGWITSGIGLSNPCPKGCYRGITIRQQMRMTGMPPWPRNRREFQCWVRKGPVSEINRGQELTY